MVFFSYLKKQIVKGNIELGKRLIDLSYRVPGGFSPNGLQKVFISFHPSDKDKMERIIRDIFSVADCAIYYHTDFLSEQDIDLEDYETKLNQMKLFVVIVSSNYLLNSSFAKNWEFGFAVSHHIPILPIAVESGLEDSFSSEMNRVGNGYGDIQLLRLHVTDKTEISYHQKLARDLGATLVNDKEIDRIKSAFCGRIFLSYRKKDRKYANELMRTIHNIPSLRSVSIWYDEFISSGEKWSDEIEDALKKCDVFLLMVTPSITEPDNYVIKEEYPEAIKRQKEIVSARKNKNKAKPLNLKELTVAFPGLKLLIDGDNAEELETALHKLTDSVESNPEKDYLIGLAFLNGVHVERDNEKGVALIAASAQKGLPDAVNKFADMYWTGDGLPANFENAILWRKKLVEIYESNFTEINSTDKILRYIKALESLTSNLYDLSSFRESLHYGKRLAALTEQITSSLNSSVILLYRTIAYGLCGKNCRQLGLYSNFPHAKEA